MLFQNFFNQVIKRKSQLIFLVVISLHFTNYSQKEESISSGAGQNYFIENKGQVIDQNQLANKNVLYLLNTPGLNVQLRKKGFSYDLYQDEKSEKDHPKRLLEVRPASLKNIKKRKNFTRNFHRLDFDFVGAYEDVEIIHEQASKSYTNYYNVPQTGEGIVKVNSYKKIIYSRLYDNIDLEFFIPENKREPVKYNFVIYPGGKVSDIKFKISGTDVNLENSSLCFDTKFGSLRELIPESWIEKNNEKSYLDFQYLNLGNNTFGFHTENKYPEENSIITIDPTPVRLWATYFGGAKDETQYDNDIKTDSNGDLYISGYTRSLTNIATTGSFQTSFSNNMGSWVGYLAKFSGQGDLIWSTYYGSRSSFRGLAIDANDEVIAVGETYEFSNIATPNSLQPNIYDDPENYFDGLIVKFKKDGTRIWSTYFGGESFDYCMGVTVDSQQNPVIVGSTASKKNIATPGSFWEDPQIDVHSNWSLFILKLDQNGNRLWSTYYGGEDGIAVDVDSNDNIYFSGITNGRDNDEENIATPGAYQELHSDENSMSWTDSFLVKFNAGGERIWGTYFGGDSYDDVTGLVVDQSDNIIITGSTRSNIFPTTPGAHQSEKTGDYNSWNAFLAKFNSAGAIQWNTYFGGEDSESGKNVDVDQQNNIFLVGSTRSLTGISTPDSFMEEIPNPSNPAEAYLTKFDKDGNQLWGTYYGGGDFWEEGLAVEVTNKGELYVLGFTFGSTNLATPGAYQEDFKGEIDNFIVKFKDCKSSITAGYSENLCEGNDLQFNAEGGKSYSWTGPNNFTSSAQNPVIANVDSEDSGTYSVYIEGEDGCDNTLTFDIIISKKPTANSIAPLTACENSFGTGISTAFDTSMIESKILGNQEDMQVIYFNSEGDEIGASLPNPFSNEDTDKIIARVSPIDNDNCYAETEIQLIANSLPIDEELEEIEPLVQCGEFEGGFANFNLKEIEQSLQDKYGSLDLTFYDSEDNEILEENLAIYQNQNPEQEELSVSIRKDNGCEVTKKFKLFVTPQPVTITFDDLIGCDDNNDGISEYFDTTGIKQKLLEYAEDNVISYFDSQGNQIENLQDFYTNIQTNEDHLTVRITDSLSGCFSESKIALKTSSMPGAKTPADLFACDEGNGFAHFNTTNLVEDIIGNQNNLDISFYDSSGDQLNNFINSEFKNLKAYEQEITARIENNLNQACATEIHFKLITVAPPEIELENQYQICYIGESLDLKLDKEFSSISWFGPEGDIISNKPSVTINTEGIYALSILQEENGVVCEDYKEFELVHSQAPIIDDVIYSNFAANSSVEILASGDGEFEYSLDGITFQSSNIFQNVGGGKYTATVRDVYGCGEAVKEINLINYPRFFTPNNDGFNDTWNIKGISNQTTHLLLIYDRYGKLLKQLDPSSNGWNGIFNGKQMPADDYWFKIEGEDGLMHSGHFSLIR